MRYFGGKSRVAKPIATYINAQIGSKEYHEPFVGSCAVTQYIQANKRYGYDKNYDLIEMWKHLQNGWIPPDTVSFELYQQAKRNEQIEPHLRAFIGFGCSFAGKWFGGYARSNKERNYALNAKNSIRKKLASLADVVFMHADYSDLSVNDAVVYCDPPYKDTTQFDAVGVFNTDHFWKTMRTWSTHNLVFISEYQAPDDFECVLSVSTKTDIRTSNGQQSTRIEKLFKYKG